DPVRERDRRPLLDERAQVVALQQLHRHVELAGRLADVVDGDDVGMAETADGLRLPLEALVQLLLGPEVGGEHLEGDHPAERGVCPAVSTSSVSLAPTALLMTLRRGGRSISAELRIPTAHAAETLESSRVICRSLPLLTR